jgi:hypothetical protein
VEGLYERGDETPGFYKMLGSCRVAAQLAACQEGLSSMSELENSQYLAYIMSNSRMIIQQLAEQEQGGENELLGLNYFHYHKSHIFLPGNEPEMLTIIQMIKKFLSCYGT